MGKIIDKTAFREKIRPELKNEGKTIALCYTFAAGKADGRYSRGVCYNS